MIVLKSHITLLGSIGQEVFLLVRLRACGLLPGALACGPPAVLHDAVSSSHGPSPGCPGLGRSTKFYESRMSSIILRFSSVAGTTKQAVPATWHQSRQLGTRWSFRGYMCQ